jgi:phosphoribosylformylglycinamidine synthase
MHKTIASGCVRSCHDLSEGGLAAALAEMCFAGGLGCDVRLDALAQSSGIADDAVLLFSESNSRFLVEVPTSNRQKFLGIVDGLPVAEIGLVSTWETVTIRGTGGSTIIDSRWAELKRAWQKPLAWE